MRRLAPTLLAALAFCVVAPAASAQEFGLNGLGITPRTAQGTVEVQAGRHPDRLTVTLATNTAVVPGVGEVPIDAVKDLRISLPAGMAGSPEAVPYCPTAKFIQKEIVADEEAGCPNSTAVGMAKVVVGFAGPNDPIVSAVYNLVPPPGVAAKLGFVVAGVPVTVEALVNPEPPHNVISDSTNISQATRFYSVVVDLWGNPADPVHDDDRGVCAGPKEDCGAGVPNRPFLTLPRSCSGPLLSTFEARSWQAPLTTLIYNSEGEAMSECAKLDFDPQVKAQASSLAASSPSGLEFSLNVKDEGLANPAGIANADISKVVATLPKGMTANPSLAGGLEVCTEAQLDRETAFSQPGEGCPNASKIGAVEVETPLLEEQVNGSLHIAEPYKNPFGSLLALYLVIKNPNLGIIVKQPLRIEPDPKTGQLRTITEDIPQLPFSALRLRLREGARSPLVTPPSCDGDPSRPGNQPHEIEAVLTPSSGGPDVVRTSRLEIITGPNGGPCPSGSTPPFEPGFTGGTLNNAAGKFSPFLLRLTRRDGDQDLVRFDATLPPGALAKLAGVPYCPEADIARIETRTGKEELASSSCPPASKIGTVKAGAGVGSQLIYVPGSIYLAGPFAGAPLSIVGVVPAVAGPFDVGVVATRQALTVDPITGVAKADGSKSQPLPSILAGIPLAVRDIQVSIDRPNFTLNPTNCSPLSLGASLWGGGADPFSLADDAPVARTERFQAADCASLGFKPRLALNLKGATKRGKFPALTTTYTPRLGDANLKGLSLRLPRSAFLEQGHFRTICTRVQYAAKACPPGAIYGKVRAFTPLLDEPLEGPVYLRSSSHDLPDIVFDLKGLVDVEASARVDSIKGGIRVRIQDVPDAPLSKVVVTMQGGRKGLIVNSRNLCAKPSKADVQMSGQNGKRHKATPVVKASCKKKRASKQKSRGKRAKR